MNKKSLLMGIGCYVMWGLLSVYWGLLSHMNALFILANRIVWSAVFCLVLLACRRQLSALWALLSDWKRLRFILPAALMITVNWGTYIWAMTSGRVLDAALGYYMNPLVVSLLSLAVFKERVNGLQIAALALAAVGVAISAIQFGQFPLVAVVLAVSFALYGTLKKYAHAEPISGMAAETLVMTPFALAFALIFCRGQGGVASLDLPTALLLVGAGVVTATPLMMYARAVNDLPFMLMGFLQFIMPTMSLVWGLIQGESLSGGRLVSFIFIGASLVLFIIGLIRKERQKGAKTEINEQTAQ